MFTYPVFRNADSQWATSEYALLFNGSTLRYGTVSADTGWSQIASAAFTGTPSALASDGQFVFLASSNVLRQVRWTGAALSSVLNSTTGGTGGNTINIIACDPVNAPNRVMIFDHGDYGRNGSLIQYQSAPTYSYAATQAATSFASSGYGTFHPLRVNNPETSEPPDTFYMGAIGTFGVCTTLSSSAITSYGQVGSLAVSSASGVDPDNGVLAIPSGSQLQLKQISMTTRAIGNIGTSTGLAATATAVACVKGFVVALHADGTVRSYSRSGTSLTQVDSVAHGAGGTTYTLRASWVTGLIYLGVNAANGKLISLDGDGQLAVVGNIPYNDPASGSRAGLWVLSDALTVT